MLLRRFRLPYGAAFAFAAMLVMVAVVSCRRAPAPILPHGAPGAGEFTVMSYNLRVYAYTDRDEDGQPDDFKPEQELVPLTAMIREAKPDILAVQEIGTAADLAHLRDRLASLGLAYPHADYVAGHGTFANLAVLSRFPIVRSEPLTNLTYSIKGETFPVQRGFQQVDIRVSDDLEFRLINVHLKSKLFHPAGQTEMRRNEARLLATHVRRVMQEPSPPPILICGDFNDSVRSAPLREILQNEENGVTDLFLKDPQGDLWTHFYRYEQSYARIDYILVNDAMKARWVPKKSGLLRDPRTRMASDHRPLYATFRASGP